MIKRFNPDFSLSISHELAYMRETPEGGYVAHGDYATLFSELELVKAERDRLQQLNEQTLQVKLQMAATIKEQSGRADALAVESRQLKEMNSRLCAELQEYESDNDDFGPAPRSVVNCFALLTPNTDAALAAIRLEAKIEGANELAERIAEMHSKTAPGSNIEKKLMFAAEAAIAYANGLREAK